MIRAEDGRYEPWFCSWRMSRRFWMGRRATRRSLRSAARRLWGGRHQQIVENGVVFGVGETDLSRLQLVIRHLEVLDEILPRKTDEGLKHVALRHEAEDGAGFIVVA